MPVIAFANSKGGSGKTTSALLLAQALAAHRPTTIIDADPRRIKRLRVLVPHAHAS